MTVTESKGVLTITLPLDKKGYASKSGKSVVHATTGAPLRTGVLVGSKPLIISLSAYTDAR